MLITDRPYGKYTSYFAPPPATNCLPPPKTQMVPCQRNARHIVVSSILQSRVFGHMFSEEYEDARKMRVQRQHKIFALARAGYDALFKLRADDQEYVDSRVASLLAPVKEHGGITIGMHVRHGDKHPYEFQYQKDYIPLDRYVDTARDIYIDRIEGGNRKNLQRSLEALQARHTASTMLVASDDPNVYESQEMGPNTLRAQDRIVLATKTTLEAAGQGKKNPYIDEIDSPTSSPLVNRSGPFNKSAAFCA